MIPLSLQAAMLAALALPAAADGVAKVSPLKSTTEVAAHHIPGLHKAGDVVVKRGVVGAVPVDLTGGGATGNSAEDTVYHAPVRVAPALERALGQGSQWPVFGGKPRGPEQTGHTIVMAHDHPPPVDIDPGLVNVQVGVAPLRPAEFVIIRIPQLTAPPAQKDGPKFRVSGAEADQGGPVRGPKLLILDEPATPPPGHTGVPMQQGRLFLDVEAEVDFGGLPVAQRARSDVKKRGGGTAVGFGDGLRGRIPPPGGSAAPKPSKPLLIVAEDVEGEALSAPSPGP